MSTPTRQTVYVGLFVTFGVVVFGMAILAVGTLQDAFSPKITVRVLFDDVGGLAAGDNVWTRGLRVGQVDALAFVDGGKVQATLLLSEPMVPFIPADAKATIGSDGLIGNPIVQLKGGTPAGPSVEDGSVLEVGDAVSTAEILETLQVNNQNLVAITDDIKAITARVRAGEGNLGKLLQDDTLFADAQAAVADVRAASAHARTMAASLTRFTAQLEQPGQLPYELVHDQEILPSVRAAVDDLAATAAKASEIAEGLAADASDPSTPIGVLLSDRESGGDVKEMLANLQEATVLLNEDLVAIRSNFLFRPYFRKQERLKAKEERQKAREAGR
ncbi:MAG: MCE family protein [Alphaproteobacteria bacterium]|nr:MCE family protein [Alphaproteobacteria bacterium]